MRDKCSQIKLKKKKNWNMTVISLSLPGGIRGVHPSFCSEEVSGASWLGEEGTSSPLPREDPFDLLNILPSAVSIAPLLAQPPGSWE